MRSAILTLMFFGLVNLSFPNGSFSETPSPAMENGGSNEETGRQPKIDNRTSLDVLIQRLESNWELKDTGKQYWIGYTDNMYSIASHGDSAVEPLLAFFHKTKSSHSKIGVILTLHLIGIQSHIAGRFMEDFKSENARKALLSLLRENEFQPDILELLIRDPWPSDVQYFFPILEQRTSNAWAFAKALQRYEIKGRPVHQELPKEFNDIPVDCNYKESADYDIQTIQCLLKAGGKKVAVEPSLLIPNNPENINDRSHSYSPKGLFEGNFLPLLESITGCRYSFLGEKMDYYYENGVVHICSMKTAVNRWLNWFEVDNKGKI